MNGTLEKSWLAAILGCGLTLLTGTAVAGVTCDPKKQQCEPPPTNRICHNIGGPRELGANCDQANQCVLVLDDGSTISVLGTTFLGIVVSASEQATAAHIAHGDGPILATFDPPLHLASVIGPYQASNVECLGNRVLPQPPEPGN